MIVIASSNLKRRHYWRRWLDEDYPTREAVSKTTLEALLEKSRPEILLLDLTLPGFADIKELSKLCYLYPGLSILVFSTSPSPEEELVMLKAGARGYCSQEISADLLRKAVAQVQQGEIWVTRKLIPRLIEEIAFLNQRKAEGYLPVSEMYVAVLTPREREIAQLIGQGANNKIIARKLNITERTVKAHLSEIFRKLSISDRLQLALFIRGYTSVNR